MSRSTCIIKSNKQRSRSYCAFTLSEILLVLSVIGIVAALTIPTLIQKISDNQYKTAWKKEFSSIAQATTMIIASNTSVKGTFSNEMGARDLFGKYLSFIKTCDAATSKGNCWHNQFKLLNGNSDGWAAYPSAILSDGALLTFLDATSACTVFAPNCVNIAVDVNGFKPPNTFGKDIYRVWVFEDRVIPFGGRPERPSEQPETTCIEGSTAVGNTGDGCSAKYLYQ